MRIGAFDDVVVCDRWADPVSCVSRGPGDEGSRMWLWGDRGVQRTLGHRCLATASVGTHWVIRKVHRDGGGETYMSCEVPASFFTRVNWFARIAK
jgi:hypothetical protein